MRVRSLRAPLAMLRFSLRAPLAMLRAMVVYVLRLQLLDVLQFLAFASQVVVAVVARPPYAPRLLQDASVSPNKLQQVYWVTEEVRLLSPVVDDECVFGA